MQENYCGGGGGGLLSLHIRIGGGEHLAVDRTGKERRGICPRKERREAKSWLPLPPPPPSPLLPWGCHDSSGGGGNTLSRAWSSSTCATAAGANRTTLGNRPSDIAWSHACQPRGEEASRGVMHATWTWCERPKEERGLLSFPVVFLQTLFFERGGCFHFLFQSFLI